MALVSAIENISIVLVMKMSFQGFHDRLREDGGAFFAALAVHNVQVSSWAVQVLDLQGCHLRDTQATACHEPEKGGLSGGRGYSQ
jgi:hypothetical protein